MVALEVVASDFEKSQEEVNLIELNLCSLKVEAGQLEVKQNLVKFNNFVREKQGKVVINMISTQYLQY